MKAWLISILQQIVTAWLKSRLPKLQKKVDKIQERLNQKVGEMENEPWNFN